MLFSLTTLLFFWTARPGDGSTHIWYGWYDGLVKYHHFLINGVEKIYIDGQGYVGIGVGSGTMLNGTLNYPLQMASGAFVSAGGVWTNASSRSYKENIKNLRAEVAFETLAQLTPVTYNYKVDSSEKHVGFIAEDAPAIIATKDKKGLSSMDIAAVLTKVVQEQQREIEALRAEIKEIKKAL